MYYNCISTLQVGANGVISFSMPYNFYEPVLFPSSNPRIQDSYVLAPFANDLDITINSSVSLGVFDIYDTSTSSEEYQILQLTSRFIQNHPGLNDPDFQGYWMLLVTWNSTKMFPRSAIDEFPVYREFFNNELLQQLDLVSDIILPDMYTSKNVAENNRTQ